MSLFLRSLLLLIATFISLWVLPPYLDRHFESKLPRLVDCSKPLKIGEARIREVVSDGRVRIKCKYSV